MNDNCPSPSQGYPSDCDVTAGLRKMALQKTTTEQMDPRITERAKLIKLLLLDVDGVMTNGVLLFSGSGEETKGFHTQDGFGIRLLQEAGISTGVITARQSAAVAKRCENLKMTHVYLGQSNKLKAFQDITRKSGLKPVEICYMGDDWLDLVLLNRVGFAAAPANGVSEVKDMVHYITRKNGGEGAVREICDLILKAKGLHQQLLQKYSIP